LVAWEAVHGQKTDKSSWRKSKGPKFQPGAFFRLWRSVVNGGQQVGRDLVRWHIVAVAYFETHNSLR